MFFLFSSCSFGVLLRFSYSCFLSTASTSMGIFPVITHTNKIQFYSKFLQKPLNISTLNFYWMIERSKAQSNVLLIFCNSKYFIFNNLKTDDTKFVAVATRKVTPIGTILLTKGIRIVASTTCNLQGEGSIFLLRWRERTHTRVILAEGRKIQTRGLTITAVS